MAARLAKTDLTTELVKEFTELAGRGGRAVRQARKDILEADCGGDLLASTGRRGWDGPEFLGRLKDKLLAISGQGGHDCGDVRVGAGAHRGRRTRLRCGGRRMGL